MTDKQKQQIRAMRGDGNSYARIAAALNISENTVKSYCRRNGLTSGLPAKAKAAQPASFCKQCGKALHQKPGVKARKFCSEACCAAWWAVHPDRLNRKALYTFTCHACGASFTAYGNSKRKYCSHACYVADRFGKAGRSV